MNLINEVKRRINDESDIYQALGAEIKQRRIKQSKTLSNMADKKFSISYLCKIEKNQVRPSKKYLQEICDRVKISDEKVNTILSSRYILLDVVKNFYYRDIEEQNMVTFKLEGLDNHRSILINFICALTRLDFAQCDSYVRKLWDLTSSLADLDLILFTTFYGVYKYYRGEYLEAMDYIKIALDFHLRIDFIEPIQYGYLFISAYRTYSRSTIDYYLKLEQLSQIYGSSLKLDTAHYNMCLYYLMLRQYNTFKRNLIKLSNLNDIYSLNVIYNILVGKEVCVDEEKLNSLAKVYYYVNNGALKVIEMINNSSLYITEKMLLQYNYYKQTDIVKSLDYATDVLIPYLIKHNISYVGFKILSDLMNTPVKISKYKKMCDLFDEFYTIGLEVDGE